MKIIIETNEDIHKSDVISLGYAIEDRIEKNLFDNLRFPTLDDRFEYLDKNSIESRDELEDFLKDSKLSDYEKDRLWSYIDDYVNYLAERNQVTKEVKRRTEMLRVWKQVMNMIPYEEVRR